MTNEITEKGKWMISLYTAIVFIILASHFAFKLVNRATILLGFSIADDSGCPNLYGLLLHGFVFFIVIRLMMTINLPGVKN
jgi:hypothetical protein